MTSENKKWQESHHPARLWDPRENGMVQCRLSPRHCLIKEGQRGFCGVRQNIDGELRTLNYGKSTHATQEFVETEALFHFAPGSKILSMGNLGCMMNCSYCHNWRTSQARYVRDEDVHYYTPESVVQTCLEKNIPIISWTYNDPVVWQEFIIDTAKIARRYGILNLYKSAFYISPEAVSELIEWMDVFSLSLKSMDPVFYRRLTQGTLEPVLEAIKMVYKSGKHLELSNLMVTDANDGEKDAEAVADWVLAHCSEHTPVHFVRFHPDYKYTQVGRTPIERLARAREIALQRGLRYVYMGNVFDQPGSHTYCPACQSRVIARYGMNTRLEGLTQEGACRACGYALPWTSLNVSYQNQAYPYARSAWQVQEDQIHEWAGDILSFHVEAKNHAESPRRVAIERRRIGSGTFLREETVTLHGGESFRFVVSRSHPHEEAVRIGSEAGVSTVLYDLLDRAHFPTQRMAALETKPLLLGR